MLSSLKKSEEKVVGHYPEVCSRRAKEELEMPFILCPPECWTMLTHPSGVCCLKLQSSALDSHQRTPQMSELKAGLFSSKPEGVVWFTAGLHTHPQGAGAPQPLPVDGTLVNVNDQIVHLELLSFSFALFLAQVVNVILCHFFVILCLSLVMAQPIICVFPQLL